MDMDVVLDFFNDDITYFMLSRDHQPASLCGEYTLLNKQEVFELLRPRLDRGDFAYLLVQ
jgi:hypothetical protein